MCKEKFSVEQLTCIIKTVCVKHGFERLGFKVFNGSLVVGFPSGATISSDLIIELTHTLGLSLHVSVGWHHLDLCVPL